jgi:hypothetical protein
LWTKPFHECVPQDVWCYTKLLPPRILITAGEDGGKVVGAPQECKIGRQSMPDAQHDVEKDGSREDNQTNAYQRIGVYRRIEVSCRENRGPSWNQKQELPLQQSVNFDR